MLAVALLVGLSGEASATCPEAYTYTIVHEVKPGFPPEVELSVPSINRSGEVSWTQWDKGEASIWWGDGTGPPTEIVRDGEGTGLVGTTLLIRSPPVMGVSREVAFSGSIVRDGLDFDAVFTAEPNAAPELVMHMDRAHPQSPSPFQRWGGTVDISAQNKAVYMASVDGFDTRLYEGSAKIVRDSANGGPVFGSAEMNSGDAFVYLGTDVDAGYAGGLYRSPTTLLVSEPASGEAWVGGTPVISDYGSVAYEWVYPDPKDASRTAQQIVLTQIPGGPVILADSAVGDFSRHPEAEILAFTSAPTSGLNIPPGPYDCVVFSAGDPQGYGDTLFIADPDGLGTVVTTADLVGGAFPVVLQISPSAANGDGQVAFLASLSGGTEAIVRADPVGLDRPRDSAEDTAADTGTPSDTGGADPDDPDDSASDPSPRAEERRAGGCVLRCTHGAPAPLSGLALVVAAVAWRRRRRRG